MKELVPKEEIPYLQQILTIIITRVARKIYVLTIMINELNKANRPNISLMSLALSPMYLSTIALDTTFTKIKCN